jgi:8-oxo-dGTP diphosphatase
VSSSPPSPAPLEVVCALIERDGRVLIAQRPAHKHLGLLWEFPGGKIEAGEPAGDALRREIREELRCDIVLGDALPPALHAYPKITVRLHGFVATLAPGSPEPVAAEHAALAWVRTDELDDYPLAPADYPVLASYRRRNRGAEYPS